MRPAGRVAQSAYRVTTSGCPSATRCRVSAEVVPDEPRRDDRHQDPDDPSGERQEISTEELTSTEWLARVLACVGGYVDAVGYVALFRLFTAHQSGNSAGLGVALGSGDWTSAWRRGLAIGAYILGVAAGTALVEIGRRANLRSTGTAVAAAQVAVLAAAVGIGVAASGSARIPPADTAPYVAIASCLAGAMGFQAVTLRRVGSRTVRTTFVTGVLTNFAETAVVAWIRPKGGRGASIGSFSALLGSIWVLYLGGAVAGAVAQLDWAFYSLLVPIAVVIAVGLWELSMGFQPSLPVKGLTE